MSAVDHAATGNVPVVIDGQSVPARLAPVSADFFRVVHDGEPLVGRWFTPADEQFGSDVVAVVSERFWRRIGGADPAFVGRRLSWFGDRTMLIIGIAPAGVDYPLATDIWAPAATVFGRASGPLRREQPDVLSVRDSRTATPRRIAGSGARRTHRDQPPRGGCVPERVSIQQQSSLSH
jgi:hypothetical protein